jgi:hypothetical protein
MRITKNHIEGLQRALAAGALTLLAAAPVLVAEAAEKAPARFVPTMADYLGVYDAIQNYRFGVEKHDQKAMERAFWEDGANIAVPTPGGPEIRMPLKEGDQPQRGAGPPGPNAGPPPGAPPGANGGPPPGLALPPGANAGPPGAGGAPPAGGGGGGVTVWHMPLDSYIHFDSPTRATHYEYFLSIYPQPEKKREPGVTGPMQDSRVTIVGWPGHYEDIMEKRHGEWRILQRKSMINQK